MCSMAKVRLALRVEEQTIIQIKKRAIEEKMSPADFLVKCFNATEKLRPRETFRRTSNITPST